MRCFTSWLLREALRPWGRYVCATACLVAAFTCWGCRRSTVHVSEATLPLVLVTCDTSGWIVPCGCASNQAGGLPRRGTYVRQARATESVVVLDVGGAPSGDSDYQRVKFEAILRGERLMDVAAHNLGAAELELGADYLRRLFDEGTPFLSANTRDADDRTLVPGSKMVAIAGRRILAIGVVSRDFATDEIRVLDPVRAAIDELAAAQPPCDATIVLAYMPEPQLLRLAEALPEVDLVLGGPTGQSISPRHVGPTLVASVTNKGKFIARLLPPTEPGGLWTAQLDELGPKLTDDAEQLANLRHYHDELLVRDFDAVETGLVSNLASGEPTELHYAGTESCRACHAEDCQSWDDSRHSHAWQTLTAQGVHGDSYCQQCHTTGFAQPGGFTTIRHSADRTSVGCESCHGPSQRHVERPRVRTPFVARDQCTQCHDAENSPEFAYDEYWELIRHGIRSSSAVASPESSAEGAAK